MASDPATHISNYLLAKSLPVSQTWLSQFLSSQRTNIIALPALSHTALFRLLGSNFTTSLSPTTSSQLLPTDISDPNIKERRIPGPVPVQVLDIEDIGSSLWSQIEAIERVERGEATRGREIIRTVMRDEGGDATVGNNSSSGATNANASAPQGSTSTASTNSGPHRLVLEDAAGTKVVSIELSPVEGVGIGKLHIGAKLLIKNATVARGMLLLEPKCVTMLHGKIESLDTEWNAGRKGRMLAKVQQIQAEEP
ncbi:hypothetical protein PRK78_005405 [Emydomyces testavorans]|uniref:RecQ-mediated genome instability protein 1 n=1 Tax=Emydomyces testavorans TaxID=2070801 RepID=A0AAF0IK06_9EURO|nr:hypothetical protein PRK78_005405 [Emydomyces testavorans]